MNKNTNKIDNVLTSQTDKKLYQLSDKKVAKIFTTNVETGLTSKEATKRLEKYGRNCLPVSKKPNILIIFLKTFLDPLSLIMALAGLISIIMALVNKEIEIPDIAGLCVIGLIIITNSIISTYQEVKSTNYISPLDNSKEVLVSVLRDSEIKRINIEELVPGDIVYTKLGDFIPADLRIINQSALKIDESSLTGENEPVEKLAEAIKEDNLIISDQKNIAFMSTLVLEGKLVGIVLKTGQESEIGKIASKITVEHSTKTPLEKKIKTLIIRIGIVAIIFGALIFVLSFLIKNQLSEKFQSSNVLLLIAVSAAISVIPESLTIIVKLCMTIAAKKMDRNNVHVKNPKSIETLGNVNVICSDKTGTLTQNKMTVDQFFVDFKNEKDCNKTSQNQHFLKNLALCNDAVIDKNGKILGSATESALVKFLDQQKVDYIDFKSTFVRVDEIPFDSKRKMMTTVHQDKNGFISYSKGANDYLLANATKKLVGNKITALTDEDRKIIDAQSVEFSKQGLRVLGLAYKPLKNLNEEYETDLIFIGAVAIIDPPRPEVKQAIQTANQAEVRVVMITGDHKITAQEIATRLGIFTEEYNQVITGAEIDTILPDQLFEKIKATNVFARVSPEHKAIIVDVLQQQNNIVAMTGDGINDSPSIVKADVGISMGINGTDVTKEASDVILKDDNFKSIVYGIKVGRNVYEKIKYSFSFLIAANISQVLTILFILLINKDVALNSVNILFHIFVIETIVAIPIGMQNDRKGVMLNHPSGHKHESLLKGIKIQIIITTLFNSLFAILSYELAGVMVNDVELAKAYGKTGVYITIMFSPILYSLLFNNFFLPINKKGVLKVQKEKFVLNKRLLIFCFIALVLSIITLLPVAGINTFFDFKTIGLPVELAIVFLVNVILSVVAIWLTYQGYLKGKNWWYTHQELKNDTSVNK